MKHLVGVLIFLILAAGVAMVPVGSRTGGETVAVVRGDTLGKLANRHGVTVDQLRDWNALDGDLIHVGQELRIDEGDDTQPLWQVGLAMLRGEWEPREDDAVVEVEAQRPGAARAPSQRPGRRSSQPIAVEGLYQDEQGRWIDEQGRFVNERGQPIDEDGNVIEPDRPKVWPSLHRPPPKPCLDAATGIGEGGDTSFGRSQGLTGEQVKAAVLRFQRNTLRCADGKPDVSGEIELEFTIGCDGRVRSVAVAHDGVGAGDFATCVADVMRYAAFPAHARDEVTARIPLRFE